DPFADRRVAVAGVGQRVDVRVTGDVTVRLHLAADRQFAGDDVAGSERHFGCVAAVLEPAAGDDRVFAGRQAEAGDAGTRVNDAGAGRELLIGLGADRHQSALRIQHRDPARQRVGRSIRIPHADFYRRFGKDLAPWPIVEGNLADAEVVRRFA